MLTVTDLRVRYGRIEGTRSVSFDVKEGELVGLVGANGSGKSSTLHAITGVVPIAGGDVVFAGESLKGRPPEAIVRRGLSLVPEGRRVFTRLTVEENLRLGARTLGKRDAAAIADVYSRFPVLERYGKTAAGRLSGGEQQQLVIARALLCRPQLLVLDEPSLGLAPRLVDEVFDILAHLRDEGTTILLVEQNAAKTIQVADRAWVLHNGVSSPVERGDSELTHKNLIAAYLGEARTEPA